MGIERLYTVATAIRPKVSRLLTSRRQASVQGMQSHGIEQGPIEKLLDLDLKTRGHIGKYAIP